MENNFRDLNDLFENFDSILRKAWNQENAVKHKAYSTEDSYLLEFAVPGYNKKDIDISVENDILTLTADIDKKDETFWRSSFTSKFRIPKGADNDKVSAIMDKGILTVQVNKLEKTKKRSVKIE